jgi:hypothetical protein
VAPRSHPSPADVVQVLVARVEADTSLDGPIRRGATAIKLLSVQEPAIALGRLKQVALDYLPGLPRELPSTDLCRVISVETFLLHHATAEVVAAFRTPDDYRRFLMTETDPVATLREHLSEVPTLIPWRFSWLTRDKDIARMNGEETVRALEVPSSPPLIIFHFDLADLLASGVTIRTPRSLDAVLQEHAQWRPEGLLSGAREYLDGDVPVSALTRLEWRP